MKLFLHWKCIRLRTTALAVWWAEYWNAGLRTHFYVRKCVCTFYGLCAIFALNFGSWKIVCFNLWHSCFILLKLQTSKQRTDLIFMDSSSVREKKRKRRQKKKNETPIVLFLEMVVYGLFHPEKLMHWRVEWRGKKILLKNERRLRVPPPLWTNEKIAAQAPANYCGRIRRRNLQLIAKFSIPIIHVVRDGLYRGVEGEFQKIGSNAALF